MTEIGARRKPHKSGKPGSPDQGEPVFLAIARICKPHGVTGEMLVKVTTDFPDRITPGQRYWVGKNQEQMTLASIRFVSKGALIRLIGIETPEVAGLYRNQYIYTSASDLPDLPDDEYYHHQLISMHVVTEDGTLVGELSQIITTGANDVYIIVTPDGHEVLLPAIESVILSVDAGENRMLVRLPEWE